MLLNIIIISTVVFLTTGLLFLLKSKNSVQKLVLVLLCFFGIIWSLYHIAYYNNLGQLEKILDFFGFIGFVVGPLLYYYLLFQIKSFRKSRLNFFYSTCPYLIVLIFISWPLTFQPRILQDYVLFITPYINPHLIVIENLYLLFYITLSLKLVQKINNNYPAISDYIDNKTLTWYSWLNFGLFAIITLELSFTMLDFFNIRYNFNSDIVVAIIFSVFTLLITYLAIFEKKIFTPYLFTLKELESSGRLKKVINKKTYSKHSFSKGEIEILRIKLDNQLIKNKVFLNPNLELRDLALELEISNQKLTTFINQNLKTNFQSLINSYRIKEFKNRIEQRDFEKYTLLSIAMDCGFNSKSSFNRIFKQSEGCTPTQYMKRIYI